MADKSNRRISNKSVINTRNLLAKSYPSQRYKDIQIALSAIEQEPDELWKLFSLFDPIEYAVSTKRKTTTKSSDGRKPKDKVYSISNLPATKADNMMENIIVHLPLSANDLVAGKLLIL